VYLEKIMFIKKLSIQSDLLKTYIEMRKIFTECGGWGPKNQIGMKCKIDSVDKWFDSTGSLHDRKNMIRKSSETDFNVWNLDSNNYIRQQVELLESTYNFKSGRVRFMRLLPHTGLSVHQDEEVRYHLVLRTNPKSYIAHNVVDTNSERSDLSSVAVCYHIPRDSTWYKVDTREVHWVYNGGDEERIHLVVCGEA